jgi:hypothetical protein
MTLREAGPAVSASRPVRPPSLMNSWPLAFGPVLAGRIRLRPHCHRLPPNVIEVTGTRQRWRARARCGLGADRMEAISTDPGKPRYLWCCFSSVSTERSNGQGRRKLRLAPGSSAARQTVEPGAAGPQPRHRPLDDPHRSGRPVSGHAALHRLAPQFSDLRSYTFPGGCATYQFRFPPGTSPVLSVAADSAVAFMPRSRLVAYVRHSAGLALCGRGAACPG